MCVQLPPHPTHPSGHTKAVGPYQDIELLMQGLAAHSEREGVAVEGGAMGEDGPGCDVQLLHPQHIGLRDPQQALDGQQLH